MNKLLALNRTLVETWNQSYPVGTPVTVFRTTRRDEIRAETVTCSEAWIADSGVAVILLEGISGYWMLECVVARPTKAVSA